MTFAASTFSFSDIHTADKQEVPRVCILKVLLRLLYDLFSCVPPYIKQVTQSINLIIITNIFINLFTSIGPFLLQVIPIYCFPLERLHCSSCYNHSPNSDATQSAKLYPVVTPCTLHPLGIKAIVFSM